jgi:Caspase domain
MIVFVLFVVALLLVVGLFNKRDPPENPPLKKTKRRAYVFGVNYEGDNASDDEGCWKDVSDYADALARSDAFEEHEVFKYLNNRSDGKHFTSKTGLQKLLAKASARSENYDLVHVHFCGRGDADGIETSDRQILPVDWLVHWAMSFDKGTRVVATFDCNLDAKLPLVREATVTFVSGESITHALIDVVCNHSSLLDHTPHLCTHVLDYIGERPRISTTHDVIADPCFMPAKA